MSAPKVFFINSIGASGQLTPSSTNSLFPKSNLVDGNRSSAWRSQSTSTLIVSYTIDINLGSVTAVNTLAICGHNFTSAGTVSLRYGSAAPATITVTGLSTVATGVWVSHFPTAINARHWRLTVHQSIASGFGEIKGLEIGRSRAFSKFPSRVVHGVAQGYKTMETDGGVRWSLRGFQRKFREYTFEDIEDSGDVRLWQQVYQHRGNDRPFFYTANGAVPTSTIYGTLKSGLQFPAKSPNLYDLQVRLEEEL